MAITRVYVHADRPGIELVPHDEAHEKRMIVKGWEPKKAPKSQKERDEVNNH